MSQMHSPCHPSAVLKEALSDNNPEDPAAGTRKLPFSSVLFIDRACRSPARVPGHVPGGVGATAKAGRAAKHTDRR